jgi:hypothetical protein
MHFDTLMVIPHFLSQSSKGTRPLVRIARIGRRVMFNVGALNAWHRTDRMSANPIRISGKATFAMRANDVTRKSLLLASSTPFGNPS